MKVICVDDKPIIKTNGGVSFGYNLTKGKTYKCLGTKMHPNGIMCYNIEGLGLKQIIRFREIETDWVDEVLEKLEVESSNVC